MFKEVELFICPACGVNFTRIKFIAIHKIIQALDTSGIIVERGGKNAEYRSTRINSKGI